MAEPWGIGDGTYQVSESDGWLRRHAKPSINPPRPGRPGRLPARDDPAAGVRRLAGRFL